MQVFPDEAEAKDILEYDKAVERGEPTKYDLTKEQQKIAKKYTHAGTRKQPTIYTFDKKKTKKPNATKGAIIAELADFLANRSQFEIINFAIKNAERQIAFSIGDNDFELTLVQKRAKK